VQEGSGHQGAPAHLRSRLQNKKESEGKLFLEERECSHMSVATAPGQMGNATINTDLYELWVSREQDRCLREPMVLTETVLLMLKVDLPGEIVCRSFRHAIRHGDLDVVEERKASRARRDHHELRGIGVGARGFAKEGDRRLEEDVWAADVHVPVRLQFLGGLVEYALPRSSQTYDSVSSDGY
jgi:hypothetical protein